MAWLPKASTGSVNGGGHPIDDNNIEREYDGCGGGGGGREMMPSVGCH